MNVGAIKLALLAEILGRADSAMVYIDGRGCLGLPGAIGDAVVPLRIGYKLIPACEIHLDAGGLFCTLSFNGAPHHLAIPWPMVFAIVEEGACGTVVQWPNDAPTAERVPERPAPPKPATSHLRSV